jgi:hypothetical protein
MLTIPDLVLVASQNRIQKSMRLEKKPAGTTERLNARARNVMPFAVLANSGAALLGEALKFSERRRQDFVI